MRDGLVTLPSLGQTAGVLQLVSEMLHSLTLLIYLVYYGFHHSSSPLFDGFGAVCPEYLSIIDDTPRSCPALCSGIFERLLFLQGIPRHGQPDVLIQGCDTSNYPCQFDF